MPQRPSKRWRPEVAFPAFGEVAKWLGSGLQIRYTSVRIRSSPLSPSNPGSSHGPASRTWNDASTKSRANDSRFRALRDRTISPQFGVSGGGGGGGGGFGGRVVGADV